MTTEEALKMIKFELERFPNAFLALNGTWGKCVEALEKQIPQQIQIIYDGKACCPACSALFVWGKQPYCEHCGQALDWSNKE